MNTPLLMVAAALLFTVGLAHSYLGEKYILIRLFRRDNLPHLRGSDVVTKQVLRFAWHLTSIAWWTFAAMLVAITMAPPGSESLWVAYTIAVGSAITGLVILAGARAGHPAWIVFAAIVVCIVPALN